MLTAYRLSPNGWEPHSGPEIAALLAAGDPVWIDAEGTDGTIATLLKDVLHVHPMAVEDILEDRPVPKIEDYGDYLYIVTHEIQFSAARLEHLETRELDVVVSSRWIFTHHRGPSAAVDATLEDLKRNPRPMQLGPASLAHALLDRVVDQYLPLMDSFDERIDQIERTIIEDPSPKVVERIFSLKRTLQGFRRVALHQRDVLQRLARGEFACVPAAVLPFYRDAYDHFLRVVDLAESYRDLLSGALEAHLSAVSNRMNEIMKTLTIVTTVLMPMTFIVGLYGMNFEHIPELHWKYGYLFVWGLLLVAGGGMVAWFRRRGWI